MKRKEKQVEDSHDVYDLSLKLKVSLLFIWFHIVGLTWLILNSNLRLYLQILCFTSTVITIYLFLIVLQDCFESKKNKEDYNRIICECKTKER